MKVSNKQKIGTHFNKENIFLATVSTNETVVKKMFNSRMKVKVLEDFVSFMVDKGVVAIEEFDVFYKDNTGYTRFLEEGPVTYAGDNSDGKGFIRNVVSIWEYYSEDQVMECRVNDKFMSIGILDMNPINQYNKDYNKH